MTERILKHMNKDHKLSLYDYLDFYGGVPLDALDAKNRVELVDIDLDHMTLQYSSHAEQKATQRIELTPPMKSMGEARERLVEMAHTAATALHVSPYQVQHYEFPNGLMGWLSGSTVVTAVVSFFTHEFGLAHRLYPELDPYLYKYRLGLILFLILAHVGESIFIMRPLLKKYRVPYHVRPQWYISCTVEGFPAWVRFKSLGKKH